jgi:zinc transport system substrate-binding protein
MKRALLALSLLAQAVGAEPGDLSVYAVNYPLAYFAERVAGEHADVVLPVPPGVDPAYWTPDVATIGRIQEADVLLLNGAYYAKWLQWASLRISRTVDTSTEFRDRYLPLQDSVTHSHGPAGEHAHTGAAFTTWLDFEQAALQAEAIAEALGRRRPALRSTFQKNYEALAKDLVALDAELKAAVSTRPLLSSHPVYQYLARRYGLNLKSVHWEPDSVPDDAQWSELESLLASHPAGWMIWEGAPNPETERRLREMGIRSLVFDPCANRPEQGDFLSVMRRNVDDLAAAFR